MRKMVSLVAKANSNKPEHTKALTPQRSSTPNKPLVPALATGAYAQSWRNICMEDGLGHLRLSPERGSAHASDPGWMFRQLGG
jgi:hypothetical protein